MSIQRLTSFRDDDEQSEDLIDSYVELTNGQFGLVQSDRGDGMIAVDMLGSRDGGASYDWVTSSPISMPRTNVVRVLDYDDIQALNINY